MLILTACGNTNNNDDSSVEANSKSNVYTTTVDGKEIEVELPVRIEFNDKHVETMNTFADYMENYIDYEKNKIGSLEGVKESHRNMLLYLNKVELTPETELEKEAMTFINKAYNHMENHVNYSLKYYNTNDNTYLKLRQDEYSELMLNLDLAGEVLSDYGKY